MTSRMDLVRAEVMLEGYTARWGNVPFEPIVVEHEFELPDGTVGRIDAIARYGRSRDVYVVEHKTSSENVSYYWRRLALDTQVSIYLEAAYALANVLGYQTEDVRGVEYDLLVKPPVWPLSATDPTKRRYTRDGRLYASQRDRDETEDEFRARVRAAIVEAPEKFFQRQTIVRTARELEEAREERRILQAEIAQFVPPIRNPDACVRYGHLCDYWRVCAGEASLEDPTLYQHAPTTSQDRGRDHDRRLPIISHSELVTWRRCRREHLYAYKLRMRPIEKAPALNFGTLVHLGLEGWWRARMTTDNPRALLDAALQRMREEVARGERGEHAALVAE
jgi:hypothetical protein